MLMSRAKDTPRHKRPLKDPTMVFFYFVVQSANLEHSGQNFCLSVKILRFEIRTKIFRFGDSRHPSSHEFGPKPQLQ
jgi:hypothetical protein